MTAEGPKVLVCDDEEDVREMLQEYLQRRGFRLNFGEDDTGCFGQFTRHHHVACHRGGMAG